MYQKIFQYCKENNLSIKAFEEKCNLSNGTVGKWKDENFGPSIPTLQKIATATGIPIEEWLKQ